MICGVDVKMIIVSAILILSFFNLSIFASIESDSHWNQQLVEESYKSLDFKEKITLHKTLMLVLERQSIKTRYEQRKIEVYTSYNSTYFLDTLFEQAQASLGDETVACHFGGWMTLVENSKCVPPWKRSVRDSSKLDRFGGKYTKSCGGPSLFRCNPVVFGPGEDGDGICTSTDDSDPNLATTSCIEDFKKNPNAIREHIEKLIEDPELLSQYLAVTVESLRSCEVQSDPFSYCEELGELMQRSSQQASLCADVDNLVSFLPDVLTPFNLDEIDEITNGLGTRAKEYMETLEERQLLALNNNRNTIGRAIEAAQRDQRLIDTITRVRNNTTKCIRDMCSGTKSATKSIAYCAAYVKHAIFPYNSEKGRRFANFSEYPWGSDAVESGPWLEEQGFVNIMDYPSMANMTPENAPNGAIIVYEKINSRQNVTIDGRRYGGPGHIEIKASENEYISDFINDEPTRIGGLRRPIGIYFKIPREFRDQIEEIPER